MHAGAAQHPNLIVDGELKPCANPETFCHAFFGKVIKGMNVVSAIEQGDTFGSISVEGVTAIPVNCQMHPRISRNQND